jgi:hypothetical protein
MPPTDANPITGRVAHDSPVDEQALTGQFEICQQLYEELGLLLQIADPKWSNRLPPDSYTLLWTALEECRECFRFLLGENWKAWSAIRNGGDR